MPLGECQADNETESPMQEGRQGRSEGGGAGEERPLQGQGRGGLQGRQVKLNSAFTLLAMKKSRRSVCRIWVGWGLGLDTALAITSCEVPKKPERTVSVSCCKSLKWVDHSQK